MSKTETEQPQQSNREEALLRELVAREDVWNYLQAKPTTRHEAWLLVSALSNLTLTREIRALREALEDFGKQNGGGRKRLTL